MDIYCWPETQTYFCGRPVYGLYSLAMLGITFGPTISSQFWELLIPFRHGR